MKTKKKREGFFIFSFFFRLINFFFFLKIEVVKKLTKRIDGFYLKRGLFVTL